MITFNALSLPVPALDVARETAWLRRVVASHGRRLGEVNYVFCDDEEILEVNRRYLQHDYYTDIITFDYSGGDVLSGDLYISLDTVRSNAELFGRPYDEELHRVLVHGVLHLVGINDKGPGEREIMERPKMPRWPCAEAAKTRRCFSVSLVAQRGAFKHSFLLAVGVLRHRRRVLLL